MSAPSTYFTTATAVASSGPSNAHQMTNGFSALMIIVFLTTFLVYWYQVRQESYPGSHT